MFDHVPGFLFCIPFCFIVKNCFGTFQFQLLLGLNRSNTIYWGVASDVRFVLGLMFNYFEWKPDVTVAFFFRFHIIELILRRGMGLVRDAEFGGNWSSSFSTWVCRYFGCSGPPWANVRLFQTPDFCEAWVFPARFLLFLSVLNLICKFWLENFSFLIWRRFVYMAELWETGFMISIEINYEPSIKGQLTNQPFNEASYNTFKYIN